MHDDHVFRFLLTSKLSLMLIAWIFAYLISFGFRFWGEQHPDPFVIRPFLVLGLLFAPSLLLGIWLTSFGLRRM